MYNTRQSEKVLYADEKETAEDKKGQEIISRPSLCLRNIFLISKL